MPIAIAIRDDVKLYDDENYFHTPFQFNIRWFNAELNIVKSKHTVFYCWFLK